MSAVRTNAEPKKTPAEKAEEFLKEAAKFKLGHLPTEMRHPLTTRLSQLANDHLEEAITLLQKVEFEALGSLITQIRKIEDMADDIRATISNGGRVFFCGCGATGRLSLSLETLWREDVINRSKPEWVNQVVSFIAGADYALVRSIENFEDHPEYGARQLKNLGFTENDLLIGTSEGGETPFVIGAVQEAALTAKRKPYFVFCNPPELLAATVERSRQVIQNPRVISFALETGPMAVSGSTRLQATTALMLGVGSALFSSLERPARPRTYIDEFLTSLRATDFKVLAPLIQRESEIYKTGGYCVHRTSRYAMTVVTDTTERSPTFSLLPFENVNESTAPLAWTYLIHAQASCAEDAWVKLLGRTPRALDWPGFKERFGQENLKGFDFSPVSLKRRESTVGSASVHIYDIDSNARELILRLDGLDARILRPASLLCEHLLLKCALNISSTLTMGRLGRFSGNLMLYVRAANNKLVDRAIRYIEILLSDAGITGYSYADVCHALFEIVETLPGNEPAVWHTFEALSKGIKASSDH